MSRDGPPPSRLSERMAERIESEKRLIEEHQSALITLLANERSTLEESLKSASLSVRSAMQSSTEEAKAEIGTLVSSIVWETRQLKGAIASMTDQNRISHKTILDAQNETAAASYRALLKGTRPVAVLSAAILLSAASVLAGMTWWTRQDLASTQDAISAAREVLRQIEAKTAGISILRATNGTFVVLPKGTDLQTGYRCEDNRPCFPIPER